MVLRLGPDVPNPVPAAMFTTSVAIAPGVVVTVGESPAVSTWVDARLVGSAAVALNMATEFRVTFAAIDA